MQPRSGHALLFCIEPQLAGRMKNGFVIEAFIRATEFMQKLSGIGRDTMTPCDAQQANESGGKRRVTRGVRHFLQVWKRRSRLFIDAYVVTGINDAGMCVRCFHRQN